MLQLMAVTQHEARTCAAKAGKACLSTTCGLRVFSQLPSWLQHALSVPILAACAQQWLTGLCCAQLRLANGLRIYLMSDHEVRSCCSVQVHNDAQWSHRMHFRV